MYLRKRGKKWYYTIEVPTEDGQGRLREERVGGTSYAQAAKPIGRPSKALDEAAVSEKPVIKMMDFLLEWLEKDVRINLGPNTYDSYAGIIKWHIGARFGNEALDALTTAEIQDWINSLKQDGYSRSTVKSISRSSMMPCAGPFPTASTSKRIPWPMSRCRNLTFLGKSRSSFRISRYRLFSTPFRWSINITLPA